MTRDDLEFSISQYLDGTLAPAARDALETRLGSDAEARALYAQYEALQDVLANAPLPAVRWDRFAEQISAAMAREPEPAQSYMLSRWFRPARLALAASVLLAGGIAFSLFRLGPGATNDPVAAAPIRIVLKNAAAASGPDAAPAVNPAPIRIAIDEPADDAGVLRVYSDSVVHRPSKAVIVSAVPVGQDSFQTPF